MMLNKNSFEQTEQPTKDFDKNKIYETINKIILDLINILKQYDYKVLNVQCIINKYKDIFYKKELSYYDTYNYSLKRKKYHIFINNLFHKLEEENIIINQLKNFYIDDYKDYNMSIDLKNYLSKISSFDFSCIDSCDERIKIFLSNILQDNTTLTSLNLSELENDFFEDLKNIKTITYLNYCNSYYCGLTDFKEFIINNPNLKTIYMTNNDYDYFQGYSNIIIDALKYNESITDLAIDVEEDTIDLLVDSLQNNKNLTSLKINFRYDDTIKDVSSLINLINTKPLTKLCINTYLSLEQSDKLYNVLKYNTTIKELNIGICSNSICDLIKYNTTIQKLYLTKYVKNVSGVVQLVNDVNMTDLNNSLKINKTIQYYQLNEEMI